MISLDKIERGTRRATISGVPEGYDGRVLADLALGGRSVLFVARDDRRIAQLAATLAFWGEGIEVLQLPAWDCLPYDRISPRADIVAQRIHALTALATRSADAPPFIVLTTVAAATQWMPPIATFRDTVRDVTPKAGLTRTSLLSYVETHGYGRAETVMEAGEYAVRGGIIDLFPPGQEVPLRLDFFGEDLETVRTFEPFSQRTTGTIDRFQLKPIGEVTLDEESVRRFRVGYRALFGASTEADPLYESISAGRRFAGMEHWLPLFYGELANVFDYAPNALMVLDHQGDDALDARWALIAECHEARARVGARGLAIEAAPYHPLPPDRLYVLKDAWEALTGARSQLRLHPFAAPEGPESIDAGGRPGRDFADARAQPGVSVYDAVRAHVAVERADGRTPVLAAVSEGSRDRLLKVLTEHGLTARPTAESWRVLRDAGQVEAWAVVLDIERGFVGPGIAVISERDILGALAAPPGVRSAPKTSSPKRRHSARETSSCTSITASAATARSARWRSPACRTIAWRSSTTAATSCSCRLRISRCSRGTAKMRARGGSMRWAARAGRRARHDSRTEFAKWPTS